MIRRTQRAADDQWRADERIRRAAAKEARKVAEWTAWVLRDIAKTERLHAAAAAERRWQEERAAAETARRAASSKRAAELSAWNAGEREKRARSAARMAAEQREALNARHVLEREDDGSCAF